MAETEGRSGGHTHESRCQSKPGGALPGNYGNQGIQPDTGEFLQSGGIYQVTMATRYW